MAAAVSRLAGSATMFSSGRKGTHGAHGGLLVLVREDQDVVHLDESLEPVDGVFEEGFL